MSLLKTYFLLLTLACLCDNRTPATGTLELHQGRARLELPRVGIQYFGRYSWAGPTEPLFLTEFDAPSLPTARIQFAGDSLSIQFWVFWEGDAQGWARCNCQIVQP